MEKIQIRAFDRRRNQNFWFHFCYIPDDVWKKYYEKFHTNNMDAKIKEWLKEDFGFEVVYMDDIYEAKYHIKKLYAEAYPEIYIDNEGDHQGWSRVWLTNKINNLLEVD